MRRLLLKTLLLVTMAGCGEDGCERVTEDIIESCRDACMPTPIKVVTATRCECTTPTTITQP